MREAESSPKDSLANPAKSMTSTSRAGSAGRAQTSRGAGRGPAAPRELGERALDEVAVLLEAQALRPLQRIRDQLGRQRRQRVVGAEQPPRAPGARTAERSTQRREPLVHALAPFGARGTGHRGGGRREVHLPTRALHLDGLAEPVPQLHPPASAERERL